MKVITERLNRSNQQLIQEAIHQAKMDCFIFQKEVYVSYILKNNELLALAFGNIYQPNLCNMSFEFNEHRLVWIEFVWAKNKFRGHGSMVLKALEHKLFQHLPIKSRQNIYLIAINGSAPFYVKNGYQLLKLYNDVFAKSHGPQLDQEFV